MDQIDTFEKLVTKLTQKLKLGTKKISYQKKKKKKNSSNFNRIRSYLPIKKSDLTNSL